MKCNILFLSLEKKTSSQCLKITEIVAFNIASEASYVYITSGQKLIKNAKNGQFWRIFECDIFCNFQTLCELRTDLYSIIASLFCIDDDMALHLTFELAKNFAQDGLESTPF